MKVRTALLKPLHLNLCGVYFDQIKAGTKIHEYRLAAKWEKRIKGKEFSEIRLYRGYPKRGDASRTIRRQWKGYCEETIAHPHFGPKPVRVLAIDVSTPIQ